MAVPITGSNGLPIDNLINQSSPKSNGTSTLQSQLGQDAFLKLLTTQLKNQDPLKPLDDTQSIAQLAQFQATQATTDLKNSFQTFQSNFSVLQASTLLGKTVTVSTPDGTGNTSIVTGTVGTIAVVDGKPQFTLNDTHGKPFADAKGTAYQFSTGQIVGIK
jgi:flagellar basal-body rod modification protein FlgD